ncbi:hypothetical protein HG530_015179 [Fusarium avenaceum]|nr:hypothetical protein HG530_015179 [Fusarium avenaceum]
MFLDRSRDRVFAARYKSLRQREILLHVSMEVDLFCHCELCFGYCSCLVKYDISGFASSLSSVSRFDDDTTSGRNTTRNDKNHGDCETEGTRAGNRKSSHSIRDSIPNTLAGTVVEDLHPACNPDHQNKNGHSRHRSNESTGENQRDEHGACLEELAFIKCLPCHLEAEGDDGIDSWAVKLWDGYELDEGTEDQRDDPLCAFVHQVFAPCDYCDGNVFLHQGQQVPSSNDGWIVSQTNSFLVQNLYVCDTSRWTSFQLLALGMGSQDVEEVIPTYDSAKQETACTSHEGEYLIRIGDGCVDVKLSFAHDKVDLGIRHACHAAKDAQELIGTRGTVHATDQETMCLDVCSMFNIMFLFHSSRWLEG